MTKYEDTDIGSLQDQLKDAQADANRLREIYHNQRVSIAELINESDDQLQEMEVLELQVEFWKNACKEALK